MKFKQKKMSKTNLSDKIADALTVKPRADLEDDQVFGTKPKTVTRSDFSSSGSEDEVVISDFRKRNVNLLSDISKKYEGEIVTNEKADESETDAIYEQSDSDEELNEISAKKLSNTDEDSADDKSDDGINMDIIRKLKQKIAAGSEGSSSEAESDDYSITQSKKSEAHTEDSSEVDDEEGYDLSQLEEPVAEGFEHVKKQNVTEEAKKGACVRNQLLLWEGLLEMRIHLQRCMNTANQMPLPSSHDKLKLNNEFAEECSTTNTNISNVLNKFLMLQNELLKHYPETKTLSSQEKQKKKELKEESDEEIPSDTDNEEIPSDTEPEDEIDEKETKETKKKVSANTVTKKRKLEDYEKEISTSHKSFKSFRDTTIEKWNDKTRLATAHNIKNAPTNTVLQQISYILSDREKLVRRTQLKRSEYDILGYKSPSVSKPAVDQSELDTNLTTRDRKDDDEYIPEIFDDSDFYHQLLRELIECKSADISDPVQLSRQWIALQQMRSKMKRKVDTKATKGRKIKYVVHNKLVNYMAPEKSTTWTDGSTNELYSSLFGKLFEHSNVGFNANLENGFKIKN